MVAIHMKRLLLPRVGGNQFIDNRVGLSRRDELGIQDRRAIVREKFATKGE